MGELLKLVGLLSAALGPFLSFTDRAPRMPPDLRVEAGWLSGVLALATWGTVKWLLRKPSAPGATSLGVPWVMVPGFAMILLGGLGYFWILQSFTVETGTVSDTLWKVGAVLLYALCCSGLTAVLCAAASKGES